MSIPCQDSQLLNTSASASVMSNFRIPLILGAAACGISLPPSPLSAQTPGGPLTIDRTSATVYQVSWPTDRLSRYHMQASPDLISWVPLGNGLTATGSSEALQITSSSPDMFYRLRIGPVRRGLFTQNELAPNDDGSTDEVPLGFTISFFGSIWSKCFVNNNGNITFGGPQRVYTPAPLRGLNKQIIAPFWADVDTAPANSAVFSPTECRAVTYGQGTVNGRAAFGVNWMDVGYYPAATDKLNGFQLVLIERSDTGAKNFDIEFNYDYVLWETGDASGGEEGYGGSSARVGFSNGATKTLELANSGQTLKFLDFDPVSGFPNTATGLIHTSRLSTLPGRHVFEMRGGNVAGALSVNAGPDVDLTPTQTTRTLNASASNSGAGYTVRWSVDSIIGGMLTFSDPTILNPVITFTAGIEATLRLTITSVTDPSVIAADTLSLF